MSVRFRTWDFKSKAMLEGIHWSVMCIEKVWLFDPQGVLNSTVEGKRIFPRFTGTQDVRSQDLFEGDICTFMGRNAEWPKERQLTGVVEWSTDNGAWLLKPSDPNMVFNLYPRETIKIGNIYENPEMINGVAANDNKEKI